jgi:hypothetical protein
VGPHHESTHRTRSSATRIGDDEPTVEQVPAEGSDLAERLATRARNRSNAPVEIQDESPAPEQPLADLDEDYRDAVLHLAWDVHKETKERTLLFAFVELLPAEIPPPLDDYDPKGGERLGPQSKHRIYVRHAVTSARRALEWYLDCRRGTAVVPENDGAVPAAGEAKKTAKLADLGEEPAWPGLLSASDDTDMLPFVPGWIQCPRTHHLLPLVDVDLGALWSKEEEEKARAWLEDRLHFDLEEYPEYWGSVHLVAPNPVYREQRAHPEPGKDPSESLLLRFRPRAGKRVEGLRVLVHDRNAWGVTAYRWLTVRQPWLRIQNAGRAAGAPENVLDPRRGFLKVSNYKRGFLAGISLAVNVARRYRVSAAESSYDVTRAGRARHTTVGSVTEKTASAHDRMREAHFARMKKKQGAEQRWFRDQKDEARDVLRTLIHGAQATLLLVDPYFGAEELGEFMLAVGQEEVPIRVLTSAEVLHESAPGAPDQERGEQLSAVLRQVQAHERMNPFEVRVMTGSRPAVHDRFLCIDQRIWLLGSSLNEFGSRGTMMLALPDPDAVRDDLARAWDEAEALGPWVERRQKRRKNRSDRRPSRILLRGRKLGRSQA